jgi:queuine tRNA-ribosyltransferase
MLGPTLLSLHNVAFYCRLLGEVREAIERGEYATFREVHLARWRASL